MSKVWRVICSLKSLIGSEESEENDDIVGGDMENFVLYWIEVVEKLDKIYQVLLGMEEKAKKLMT